MNDVSKADVKVSVVVPAYNMAEYIEEAIPSVLDGEFKDLEVIVIDDGSTDATEFVVSEYTDPASSKYDSRVNYFYQENQGKPAAVNRAMREMNGEFFVLLDADDRLPKYGIASRVDVLDQNPDADISIGGFAVFDDDPDQRLGSRDSPTNTDPRVLRRLFYLSFKTPFHLNACMIRRSLIERVGFFDRQILRCEDGDYAMRCLENTEGVVTTNETVYLYRKHRSSMMDRIRVRLITARFRPMVMMKNFGPPEKYIYAVYVMVVDVLKIVYEVFANYDR